MEYVIFWGWNEEGQPMFEATQQAQTHELKEAMTFKSSDAAQLYLEGEYDVVPHAQVITIIEAKEIEPKK